MGKEGELGDKGTGSRRAGYRKQEVMTPRLPSYVDVHIIDISDCVIMSLCCITLI